MTWTYTDSDPTVSPLNEVRFLIGDTDTADQLLQDEEIGFLLDDYPVTESAARAAMHLARRFARKAKSKTVGPLRIEYGERAESFEKLAHQIASGNVTGAATADVKFEKVSGFFSTDMGEPGRVYHRDGEDAQGGSFKY